MRSAPPERGFLRSRRRQRVPAACTALVLGLLSPLARAQLEHDLAALPHVIGLHGAAGNKLGGVYLADAIDVYWNATSTGNDTGLGPTSQVGAITCDFDGDGHLDLALGAPGYASNRGAVYLFWGTPNPTRSGTLDLSSSTGFDVRLSGESGDYYGTDLAAADVNADGFCDLLVGAPLYSNDGAVYLYLGGARQAGTFFPPGPGVAVDGGASYSLRITPSTTTDTRAYSLAVGDVSGDGVADFVVGAFYFDRSGQQDAGGVAIYFGKDTATRANTGGLNLDFGTVASASQTFSGYNVRYNGQEGYDSGFLQYHGAADNLGAALTTLDVDGDGIRDLVIGAPSPELSYAGGATSSTGSVYVIRGGGAASGTGTVNLGSGNVILGDANSYHLRFNGVQDYAHVGGALAGGELTGDTADDIVVAAPYGWYGGTGGTNRRGTVYVIPGDTAWQSLGRDNTNLNLADVGNGYAWRLDGAANDDELRGVAVGDIDGDGYDDLLVGAPGADPGGRNNAGSTYEVFGPLAGTGSIDLGALPAGYDRRTAGATAGDRLGLTLAVSRFACAVPRRILSAPYSSSNAGKVYLLPSELADTSCNGVDENCDGTADEQWVASSTCGLGVCVRSEVCNGSAGPACTPGPQSEASDVTCDGLDGDCDGTVDEDWVAGTCGVGACLASAVCSGTAGPSCTPGSPTGPDDDCNGIDENCSGAADENYVAVPTTCGLGVCARTGVTSCASGVLQDSCVPGAATGADADCNGVDENCSGAADENFAAVPTSCGLGVCARSGVTSCVSGAVQDSCVPGTATGTDDDCNGIDENCSGAADENYVPVATTCGLGVCARTGVTSCASGVLQDSCVPGAAIGADDDCNGVDENCSGAADENYVPVATRCGLGVCARTGITSCASGAVQDSCVPGTATGADDDCDGIDDDCDGVEDQAYLSTTCGLGHCRDRATPSACVDGVEIACVPASPLGPDDGTCDNVDDDCDGAADEDAATTGECAALVSGICEQVVCVSAESRCEIQRRSGCCASDDDCQAPGACVVGSCDREDQTCVYERPAGCCDQDAQCDDGKPCTEDRCDAASGRCEVRAVFGCCQADVDCDDGDPCSVDLCTELGRCAYRPAACSAGGPCGQDPVCLYSGLLVARGPGSAGSTVQQRSAQVVLALDLVTAALGGRLHVLRLTLEGPSAAQLERRTLRARLYHDANSNGRVDGDEPSLSEALSNARGLLVFTVPSGLRLPPASRTAVLVSLQVVSAEASCAASQQVPSWLVLLGALLVLRSWRGIARPRRRRLLALTLLLLGACARTGYYDRVEAALALRAASDVQVTTGPGEALDVAGLPVASVPFEIVL